MIRIVRNNEFIAGTTLTCTKLSMLARLAFADAVLLRPVLLLLPAAALLLSWAGTGSGGESAHGNEDSSSSSPLGENPVMALEARDARCC